MVRAGPLPCTTQAAQASVAVVHGATAAGGDSVTAPSDVDAMNTAASSTVRMSRGYTDVRRYTTHPSHPQEACDEEAVAPHYCDRRAQRLRPDAAPAAARAESRRRRG